MKYLEKMTRKKLGELLIEEGLVTSDQVMEALQEQKKTGEPIGEILIAFGAVSEWDIARTLAKQFQLPFLYASRYTIASEVREIFPPEVLHRYQCVPVDRFGDALILVVAGVLTREMIQDLEARSGCKLFVYVGLPSDVRRALEREFPCARTEERGLEGGGRRPKEGGGAETASEWELLFDMANESILRELKPEEEEEGRRT